MSTTARSVAVVSALLIAMAPGPAAFAQSRAEQQVRELNQEMSQQLQFRQQTQNFQWQIDNQRMRQQIDSMQNRGGCPRGAAGC